MDKLLIRWLVAISLLIVLSGCGGSAQGANMAANAAGGNDGSTLPACAFAGNPITMPPDFPASFPLPSGTVVNHQEVRSGGRVIIGGVAPLDVQQMAVFLEKELPKAGFEPSMGESEPGEAESAFEGNGIRGRWKANNIDGCPNTVTIGVVVGP